MTTNNKILVSFLVSLVVWMFFSWPIPRLMTSGISSSSLNVEKGSTRTMIPGDHLQLLYQFWLTGDTLAGRSPLFVNPYEFNTGNDKDGAFRGTYYVPFSLFYGVGAALGGRAFGYNFTQFVTIWITFIFTWLLVCRYNRDTLAGAAAAVIAITVPYPWITMLDGSPTGLGMMWIPVIFWALDILVAERKLWAGAVAGAGICLAEADSHVFFFAILSCPFWCVFSYLSHFPGRRPSWSEMRAFLKASVLLLVFLGVAAWLVWSIRHSIQDTSLVASSRSFEEIRANSPIPSGIVRLGNEGEGRKIYIGAYLLILLAGGGLVLIRIRRPAKAVPVSPRNESDKAARVAPSPPEDSNILNGENQVPLRPMLPVILLGAAILGVALLSTGVMNPGGHRVWKVVTTLIPPYGMIRQPHKVYCLMPVLLALATGLLLPVWLKGVPRLWRTALILILVMIVALDYGRRIKPTVCLLDRDQKAFRAIMEDAKAGGNTRPHLLSLPVWPGDSHYDSLNEYYISLYGLRMVNGYGGAVRESYRTNIFERLESLNIGSISDSQLDFLLKRGVGYLVLHEDCFPEKVSPFPVRQTLEALLNHPRLKFIGKEGALWSFKVLSSGMPRETIAFMKYHFPARRFEFEDLEADKTAPGRGGREGKMNNGVRFRDAGNRTAIPPTLAPSVPSLCWMVRARGKGSVSVANVSGGETNAPVDLDVDSKDWTWKRVEIPECPRAVGMGAVFFWKSGEVDLDSAILAEGNWSGPAPGKSVVLPAACFFHAGHTDRTGEWVTLRKAYEPHSIVFYGPKLPLDEGLYLAELVFESDAPVGTALGRFNVRWSGDETNGWINVTAGEPAVLAFMQRDNRPFFAAFDFFRAADIRIRSVLLVRQE